MLPYALADINDPASLESLDPIPPAFGEGTTFDPVPIRDFFIGAFGPTMFVGATSQDDQVVIPIGQLVTSAMNGISSDYMGGASQASLFGGTEGGNMINVEVLREPSKWRPLRDRVSAGGCARLDRRGASRLRRRERSGEY